MFKPIKYVFVGHRHVICLQNHEFENIKVSEASDSVQLKTVYLMDRVERNLILFVVNFHRFICISNCLLV